MFNVPRIKWVGISPALSLMTVPYAVSQEKSPNGEIYGELLPFVGLKSVQLEIHGLGGHVWNIRSPTVRTPKPKSLG